jgi:N utilization substance protein A
VKDDGVLEKFDVDLAEAQNIVMTARIMLGWVDPDDLVDDQEVEPEDEVAQEI